MTIRHLCYELYKLNWMQQISRERIADTYKNCYQEGWDSYDDYIFECGYDGSMYACYDEFLVHEYLDPTYVKELLDNDELYQEYLKNEEQWIRK